VKITKSQLKQIILEELLFEDLTSSDKKEIKDIAKTAAEQAIKKAFKEELEKEIIKALGKKATKKEVAEIVKTVTKKLYRDLSITYPHIIDGVKI